jgi:D-tyrosyl-tRNA(Tyr) deacylase
MFLRLARRSRLDTDQINAPSGTASHGRVRAGKRLNSPANILRMSSFNGADRWRRCWADTGILFVPRAQSPLIEMIALLQRVSEASVLVKEHDHTRQVGSIGKGLMVLIGVERHDKKQQADRLLQRLLAYRVFPDDQERMNLDLRQAGGELMLVPQFTLAASTTSGNRPGFSTAAEPAIGKELFEYVLEAARDELGHCETGEFGAHMMVQLINDGPVTFRLRCPPQEKES